MTFLKNNTLSVGLHQTTSQEKRPMLEPKNRKPTKT